MSQSASPTPLVERTDFRGHLTPHCKTDPNVIIHGEYQRLYGPEMAARYLDYRKTFERVNRERFVLPSPLTVNVGLRDACNLRCSHCYRQYNPDSTGKISMAKTDALDLIDQCAAMDVPAMLFGSGSEHFTHPDALEILEHACGKPQLLDIFLATNALLLDDDTIEALLDLRLTRITVSVDAMTAETYAKIRGGDFDRLQANLLRLLARRAERGQKLPILRVSFVDTNLNHHEREDFWRYWVERADIVDIQKLFDPKRINALQDTAASRLDCAYPWNMLYVRWDRVVLPCCTEFCKHIPVGDLSRESLAEIWNGRRLAALRRAMTTPGHYPKTCVNCVASLGTDTPLDSLE